MVEARITLSNLSDEYVENPQKDFPVGKLVHGRWDLTICKCSCKIQIYSPLNLTKNCRVLSADPSSGRVEASLRKNSGSKLEKPDDINYSDLHVGDIIDGQVKRVESYGLFITIRSSELVWVVIRLHSFLKLLCIPFYNYSFCRLVCVMYQNFLMSQSLILTLVIKLVIWLKLKFWR